MVKQKNHLANALAAIFIAVVAVLAAVVLYILFR